MGPVTSIARSKRSSPPILNKLTCILTIMFLPIVPSLAYAERSCDVIVKEISAVFDVPLGCMRDNCPGFSILDSGTPNAERCAGKCNLAWTRPPPTGSVDDLKRCEHFIPKIKGVPPDYYGLAFCLAASESDLSRCGSMFRTSDEMDYLRLARCLRASEATAVVIEPLQACMNRGECLKSSRNWQYDPCFKQCHQDAEQLIELATTTVERCDGIEQSRTSLCSMLRSSINVCFLPEHCDRLDSILQKSCN